MATVISRDEAIEVVSRRAATDQTPKLGMGDVAQIVDAAARPDRHGIDVGADGWWPTYDLNYAAAAAWDAKAALAAGRFDIDIDGQTLSRSQIIDHCQEQAAAFRARIVGTVPR